MLATEDVIEREFGAYKDIQDHYPKYVLSMDRFDFSRDGIIHQNMIDFCWKGKNPVDRFERIDYININKRE